MYGKWPFVRKGEKEYFTHSCVQNMALEALKKLVTLVPIWKATQQLGGNKKRDFKTIYIFYHLYFCVLLYSVVMHVCWYAYGHKCKWEGAQTCEIMHVEAQS